MRTCLFAYARARVPGTLALFIFVLFIFYATEASKPESLELLPHVRGQGIMDLEYENEGMFRLCNVPLLSLTRST